jgi:PHD/YefM family antitoxin component YafN of YafNO toxin-antitoxin module
MEETISLSDIYVELKRIESSMITKREFESYIETLEILNDEDLMSQIRESEKNIKEGKIREINSVEDI